MLSPKFILSLFYCCFFVGILRNIYANKYSRHRINIVSIKNLRIRRIKDILLYWNYTIFTFKHFKEWGKNNCFLVLIYYNSNICYSHINKFKIFIFFLRKQQVFIKLRLKMMRFIFEFLNAFILILQKVLILTA